MKRSWIGFGLLLVLLVSAVLATRKMTAIHEPIGETLQQAAGYALAENWEQAEDTFREAERSWKTWEHFRSCFADHNPVEEIDGDFEMLAVFSRTRDPAAFAAGCQSLARKVSAVGEAHQLTWRNLM